jgi:hypothetical protein
MTLDGSSVFPCHFRSPITVLLRLQTVDEYYVKQVHWILETVVCCQNIIAIVDKTSTVTFVLF